MQQSDIVPSLDWLAKADTVRLQARPDEAVAVLVGLLKSWGKSDNDTLSTGSAVDNVLRQCAVDGPSAIKPADAKRLAFPALRILQKAELVDNHQAAIRLLSSRADVASNHGVSKLLQALLRADRDEQTTSTTQDFLRTEEADDDHDWLPSEAGQVADAVVAVGADRLAEAWTAVRLTREAGPRGDIDAELLHTFAARRVPCGFAEALYADPEAWRHPALVKWVADLPRPLEPDVNGAASAALLNSRIRDVRPRLLLFNQSALVLDSIGAKVDVSEVIADTAKMIAEPLTRAKGLLGRECDRRQPRKQALGSVVGLIDQVFSRLEVEVHPREGDVVSFDPVVHLGDEGLVTGDEAVVRQAGVRDETSKRVLIKAYVVAQESDGEGEQHD